MAITIRILKKKPFPSFFIPLNILSHILLWHAMDKHDFFIIKTSYKRKEIKNIIWEVFP
jgi:hypothetical protein